MIASLGEENLGRSYRVQPKRSSTYIYASTKLPEPAAECRMLAIWRGLIQNLSLSNEDFARWFSFEYRISQLAGRDLKLTADHYFRAWELGSISRDVLMDWLVKPATEPPRKIEILTGQRKSLWSRKFHEQHPRANEIAEELVDRIVSV